MYAFPYLSRMLAAEMFAKLRAMLPPPLDATQAALRDRDVVALCMLRQMGPIRTLDEASLAITVVASEAHAHDALRSASENAGDLKVVMQCRAQANTMLRARHKAAAELGALMRRHADAVARDNDVIEEAEAEMATVAAPPAPEIRSAEPEPEPVAEKASVEAVGPAADTNTSDNGVSETALAPTTRAAVPPAAAAGWHGEPVVTAVVTQAAFSPGSQPAGLVQTGA